jgi:hypothetical protein
MTTEAQTFFFIFPITESETSLSGRTRQASTIDAASSSALMYSRLITRFWYSPE